MTLSTSKSSRSSGWFFLLFFLSGWTGLVFQVLWMRHLGLLFGNTSQAAATTLAVFFLGLSLGSAFWGEHGGRFQPLRLYGLLEIGAAATSLLALLILSAYRTLYPHLFEAFGDRPALFVWVKFLLALGFLFLPTFLMGGTLPVLSAGMVGTRAAMGPTVSLLYGLNTFGAALGAYCAGFVLPQLLGFSNTYYLTAGMALLVGVCALALGKIGPNERGEIETGGPTGSGWREKQTEITPSLSRPTLSGLAFFSGALALGLEVLFTRMFAQVLQNSTYTYTVIVVAFLIALALGAVLARRLMERKGSHLWVLGNLLAISGVLVMAATAAFYFLTGGLRYIGGLSGWWGYQAQVFALGGATLLPPGVVLGSVFPFLLKIAQSQDRSVPRIVGSLVSFNTAGAILGSVTAGFLSLPWIGLWKSLCLAAGLYFLAGMVVLFRASDGRQAARVGWMVGVPLILLIPLVARFPLVLVAKDRLDERILEIWEGSAGTLAVVEGKTGLSSLFNNYYTLGAQVEGHYQALMSHLPLLLHPEPKRVFYIGMGTGITAGAALSHPVQKVTVSEIIPEAVAASRKYFSSYTNGLFSDPRASVVREDGRNFLAGTRETFDAIVGDLFLPWKAGTGNLYTLEHFETVRDRLAEGGVFAQWLPLYQVSEEEFEVVARTLSRVFPQVTLWRGDFLPGRTIGMLLGSKTPGPPDWARVEKKLKKFTGVTGVRVPATLDHLLALYVGNLSQGTGGLAEGVVSTDDFPVLEFTAALTERNQIAGLIPWFDREPLLAFYRKRLLAMPPWKDPFLAPLPDEKKPCSILGWVYHTGKVQRFAQKPVSPETLYRDYLRLWKDCLAVEDIESSSQRPLEKDAFLQVQEGLRREEERLSGQAGPRSPSAPP